MTVPIPATTSRRSAATTPAPHIRALRRDDGDLLVAVMAGMSDRSRYQRFHSSKPRLTGADLAQLTNVDGRDHLALVAFSAHGAPLGVARAVRLAGDPAAAELGVEIVDADQRQGVGSLLVARLARCAAAAGIERLVAHVLAETGLARSLMRRGWRVAGWDGPTVTLEVAAWRVAASGRA
jgi:GNAT superfamily N-acetyltransferase